MKINEMSPPHSLSSVLIIRYFHSSSCAVGRVLYERVNIKFVIVNSALLILWISCSVYVIIQCHPASRLSI